MQRRKTHGEFALASELSDARCKNYFRLSRDQFEDMHTMIQHSLMANSLCKFLCERTVSTDRVSCYQAGPHETQETAFERLCRAGQHRSAPALCCPA